MSTKTRVLESRECEITQSWNPNHGGIDLVNKNYTLGNIVAHSNGTVISTRNNCNKVYSSAQAAINEWGDSYGNFVLIKHTENRYTMYAHLAYGTVKVTAGQSVKQGQVIGYMGNTGHTNGGHLHFEVRTGESYTTRIDCTKWLNAPFEEPYTLPSTVIRNTNKDQFKVLYSDVNVRKGPSTNDEVIIYPCTKGIYDVIEVSNGWYKIKENEWINEVAGIFYQKEEQQTKEEETQIETNTGAKEEDLTNNTNNGETPQNGASNGKKEGNKGNVLTKIYNWIVKLIKKIIKK